VGLAVVNAHGVEAMVALVLAFALVVSLGKKNGPR